MSHSKISFLLKTYNRQRYCDILLASLYNNLTIDFDLYIIDNGSDIPYILPSYIKPKHFERFEINGKIEPWKYLLDRCETEYCALVADDDSYRLGAFENHVKLLDSDKSLGFVDSPAYIMDAAGSLYGTKALHSGEPLTFDTLITGNRVWLQSCLFRTSAIRNLWFDQKYPQGPLSDWLIYLRLLEEEWRHASVSEPIVNVRLHKDSDSSNSVKEMAEHILKIWEYYKSSGYTYNESQLKEMELAYLSMCRSVFNSEMRQ